MTDGIKAAITSRSRHFLRLFEDGRLEELWERGYLPEALCFPPGQEPYTRQKFISLLQYMKQRHGTLRVQMLTSNIEVLSDTAAVETSHYKAYHDDGTVLEFANSLVLWVKKDGQWYTKFDIRNQ